MHSWSTRHYVSILALALAAYLVLLIEAARTRKPWNDEAMAARAAYNLSTQGHTGVSFFDDKSPFFPGINRHTYYIFPFQLCVLAVWYKIAGFSLFSTRLISILWTLAMLGAIYSLIKTLTGNRALAALAALLTAFDYHVMTEAAFGRYDTMVAALGFSAYALYVHIRKRNLRLALLVSNCCIVMAGTTHPNGLLFLIGLWFMILYFDRQRVGWKDLCLSAVPYIAGAAVWVPFILQDFPSFKGQLSMNAGGRVGLLRPWDTLLREIQMRYISGFGLGLHSAGHASPFVKLKALSLVAYLTALIGCLLAPSLRRDPSIRVVWWLTAIHFLYITFYENMKFSYYLVYLLPFYCVVLAYSAVTVWRRTVVPRWAITAALALVILAQAGGIVAKILLNDQGKSYMPAVGFVSRHATPADQVNATCSFGFGFGFERNLLDDPSLGYYNGRKPDYFVAEEIYDSWLDETKTGQPDVYSYCMKTLREYDLIYDQASYRVYRHRTP